MQTRQGSSMQLRTFVYHQVLLGYLEHVKRLGYQQMFIWACPPLQARTRHTGWFLQNCLFARFNRATETLAPGW